MVKHKEVMVTFSEFPKEVALCINISGCPNHCEGCHSAYLAENTGEDLTIDELKKLIDKNTGVTCAGFMGGDQEPSYINELAKYIKLNYLGMKVGWYSGKEELSKDIDLANFDYVKLGPYIASEGPLNSKTTNQRFYEFKPYSSVCTIGPGWEDVTNIF